MRRLAAVADLDEEAVVVVGGEVDAAGLVLAGDLEGEGHLRGADEAVDGVLVQVQYTCCLICVYLILTLIPGRSSHFQTNKATAAPTTPAKSVEARLLELAPVYGSGEVIFPLPAAPIAPPVELDPPIAVAVVPLTPIPVSEESEEEPPARKASRNDIEVLFDRC